MYVTLPGYVTAVVGFLAALSTLTGTPHETAKMKFGSTIIEIKLKKVFKIRKFVENCDERNAHSTL